MCRFTQRPLGSVIESAFVEAPDGRTFGHSHVMHNRPKAANSADVLPSTRYFNSMTAAIWHMYPVPSGSIPPDYVAHRNGVDVPWAATPPTCLPFVTTLTSHTGELNNNLAMALRAKSC